MALYGFKNSEDAIIAEVAEHYSDFLLSADLVTNDFETSVSRMLMTEDARFCGVVDYLGINEKRIEKFSGNAWEYHFSLMLVHWCEPTTMNENIRSLIDKTLTLFDTNKRLDGAVKSVKVESIGQFQSQVLKERLYFLLPVNITVVDKDT